MKRKPTPCDQPRTGSWGHAQRRVSLLSKLYNSSRRPPANREIFARVRNKIGDAGVDAWTRGSDARWRNGDSVGDAIPAIAPCPTLQAGCYFYFYSLLSGRSTSSIPPRRSAMSPKSASVAFFPTESRKTASLGVTQIEDARHFPFRRSFRTDFLNLTLSDACNPIIFIARTKDVEIQVM